MSAVRHGPARRCLVAATMLAVVCCAALLPVPSARAEVVTSTRTFDAVADTYVSSKAKKTNYGKTTELQISRNSYHALLRFDLSTLPAGARVSAASLRTYVTGSTGGDLLVSRSPSTWQETGVTRTNQPAWDGAPLATSKLSATHTYVTTTLPAAAVPRSGVVSYGISTTRGAWGSLASRESGTPPQLVVTYSAEAAAPTPKPTPTEPPAADPRPAPVASPFATLETEQFPHPGTFDYGDVADDSVLWADKAHPGSSVVIADNKDRTGGLAVFDMRGRLRQFRRDGMIGNVDLRENFPLKGKPSVIVGANNRSDDTLVFYRLNTKSRRLTPATARPITTRADNYGFCMYTSRRSGKTYAFVDHVSRGHVQQYELFDHAGKVDARLVRSFDVGSRTEGCVADDQLGHVYFGEEDVAIWKYDAEPTGGTSRVAVDKVGAGHLVADIEGLTIAYGPGAAGYLIASSQGSSSIVVYARAGDNAFVRSAPIAGSGTVDAVSDTDGVAASSANLGPAFPHGALVVHDGTNTGGTLSNLKYVPLDQLVRL